MKIEADGFCGRKATLITRIDCVDIFTLDFRAHLDTHTHTHTPGNTEIVTHTGTARYMYALASHSAHSRRQYSNILTSQSPHLEMSLNDVVSA